jgi:hypothetical protein
VAPGLPESTANQSAVHTITVIASFGEFIDHLEIDPDMI